MKAKNKPKKDVFTTNLRLPKEIAKKVKDRAKSSQRSLNGQIVYELDQKPA